MKPEGQWTDRRVIIFTEYRATQKWLHDLLAAEGLAGQDRLLTIYGGMTPEDRERIKAAFQADPRNRPSASCSPPTPRPKASTCRIIAGSSSTTKSRGTQTAWNSATAALIVMGRRIPKCTSIISSAQASMPPRPGQAPGDLEGDLEFLLRAALKVEAIREDLGKVGPVIAEQVEEAMLGRRRTLDTSRAERESEPVRAHAQVRAQAPRATGETH